MTNQFQSSKLRTAFRFRHSDFILHWSFVIRISSARFGAWHEPEHESGCRNAQALRIVPRVAHRFVPIDDGMRLLEIGYGGQGSRLSPFVPERPVSRWFHRGMWTGAGN